MVKLQNGEAKVDETLKMVEKSQLSTLKSA